MTLTWWNDRRKNRRPGVSTWRKAQHWRMAPLWAPRGRLPPRICTFSSSSWRPSHWGRDTALWILLRVTRALEQVLTANLGDLESTDPSSDTVCVLDFDSTIADDPSDRLIHTADFAELSGTGDSRFFDYHFAVLRTVGFTDDVPRAHGKFIPDVRFTENIDRKR